MTVKTRVKIVIIGGTLETELHPIPPIADGAPEWNVFRLVEAIGDRLDILTISPCEEKQVPALSLLPVKGRYEQIILPNSTIWLYRAILRRLLPIRLIVRRFAKLPDLFSWLYLYKVVKRILELNPDCVIINARPQYVRYLRKHLSSIKLWLFMRGTMGESRHYLHFLDGIFVNSEGMRHYIESILSPGKMQIEKIPNTVGDDFQVPESREDRYHQKHVIFVGRLISEKGVAELIKAFQIVNQSLPDATLSIYGASGNQPDIYGPGPYERKLHDLSRLLPGAKIQFCGYVPTSQLGSVYTGCTLAVFPSICNESFGMVALEAMRCKTPVIASRRAGFEELIVHGETGLLIDDPKNPQAIAEAILVILRDFELARRMGDAGYLRSLEFLPEQAATKFVAIMNKAI